MVVQFGEYYENYYHNPTTYDCIEKSLNIYNPIEIIFIHNIEKEQIQNIINFKRLQKKHIIDLTDNNHKLSNRFKL